MVWHTEVQKFLDDYASAELGWLTEEIGVECEPAVRGAASPFPRHWPQVNDLRPHLKPLSPGSEFSSENLTRDGDLQRLPGVSGLRFMPMLSEEDS